MPLGVMFWSGLGAGAVTRGLSAWDCFDPELCEALLCSEPAGCVMPSSLGGTWLVRLGLAAGSFGALCAREVAHVRGFDKSSRSFGTPVLHILQLIFATQSVRPTCVI